MFRQMLLREFSGPSKAEAPAEWRHLGPRSTAHRPDGVAAGSVARA